MADGYLEKRYEEVFGKGAKKTVVKHTSIDTLFEKNRSYRGYQQDFVIKREMLERIVAVNAKIASAKNQQVLRFKLVTKETGADVIVQNMKLGGLLPELHLPFAGTEPEAFIIICSMIPENKFVDIDLGIAAQSMLLKASGSVPGKGRCSSGSKPPNFMFCVMISAPVSLVTNLKRSTCWFFAEAILVFTATMRSNISCFTTKS